MVLLSKQGVKRRFSPSVGLLGGSRTFQAPSVSFPRAYPPLFVAVSTHAPTFGQSLITAVAASIARSAFVGDEG
jgi:hypothetical protein